MKTILKISFFCTALLFANCKKSSNNTPAQLTIGQSYQGGLVAYIDGTGLHGLIVAPFNQSTGIQWYNGSNITRGTGTAGYAIGTGNANTNAIVTSQGSGSYAAKLCYDLVLNGYDDWYLPSKDELNKLYLNKDMLVTIAYGGFADNYYWSSSENLSTNTWGQYFGATVQILPFTKDYTNYVRAVRSF